MSHRKKHPAHGGFTLIEVLLAVSLVGLLLAAAVTILVSVTDIWLERDEQNFIGDHVDGVTEFVQAAFSNAGVEVTAVDTGNNSDTPENTETDTQEEGEISVEVGPVNAVDADEKASSSTTTTAGLIEVSEEPISWASPPGFGNFEDPLLSFSLKDTPPLLVTSEDSPTVGIVAYLHLKEEEGLSLLWYSSIQEEAEDIRDLHRTPLSPYVTALKYIYWDESFEQWEEETEPQDSDLADELLLPRFLKIVFEYEGETIERTITIPVPSKSAVIF